MFYAGFDVSLRSVAVCIIDAQGKVCLERSVSSDLDVLIDFLRDFGQPVERIGLESGTLSDHLTRGLGGVGFNVVCMDAGQISASLSAMSLNKSDRHDARGIANIVRLGWYKRVHMKSMESLRAKALLTTRKTVRRKAIDIEFQIRGVLRLFGIKVPQHLKHARFEQAAREAISTDPALSDLLFPVLEAWRALDKVFFGLDRRALLAARSDPICRRFMGVPGVGPVTALTYKAGVDDPARFRRSRDVGAHFGLTPRRYQSGGKDVLGRISKAGDPAVRTALYNAAESMLLRSKSPSKLKAWGTRLIEAKGRRRAMVAVARKLAVILHRMWIDGAEFRFEGNAPG